MSGPRALPRASMGSERRASGLARAIGTLTRLSGAAIGLLLAVLLAIAFAEVVMRYLLGSGWPWGGTVSVIVLLFLAWIGAGHLWLTGGHIAVTLMGARAQVLLARVFGLAVIGGGLVLLPMTLDTMEAYSFIDLPALGISASVKYLPVAFGTGYLVCAACLVLAADLVDGRARR